MIKMMNPSISVVIPLYNKKLYIQRTIGSVLSQTFQSFECVIIDSSDDGSTYIVEKFTDKRIKHIIHKKVGAAGARNIGTSLAQSNLVAFLDADDEWTQDHLQVLVSLEKAFPQAGLYSTSYIKILPGRIPMTMVFASIPKPPWEGYIPEFFKTCAQGDIPVNSSSCAVKKEIFMEMGGFAEDLTYGEDQHFWGRIALKYPVAFSWKGLAIYHTEADGRICNIPHLLSDDPLSAYLEEQLEKGSIMSVKRSDIIKYIRRRRRMVWFSNCLSRFIRGGENRISKRAPTEKNNDSQKLSPGKYLFILFKGIYNSKIHNYIRRFRCFLHGWYVPEVY
jgi:glycosyltransferase involved in cell wall biosynthesis